VQEFNKQSSLRNTDRYSHIQINLQFIFNGKWERIAALGWNDVGFNFFSMLEINDPLLKLKRGLTRLEGIIVWRSVSTSEEFIIDSIVNELLFNQAKEIKGDVGLHSRLIKLIRAPGMIDGKRKILASWGLDISNEQIAQIIIKRQLGDSMFKYGVRIESEEWGTIVRNALNVSSVVLSLEKFSDSISK